MEDYYFQFLTGYVSAGHTVTREAMNDLNNITNEFISIVYSDLNRDCFFTIDELKYYLEVLEWTLQDENKHYFHLCFDKQRYIECLIDLIRMLIKD